MKSTDPIAVIGMAGLFPGADNLDSFWQHIVDRVDVTREVHPERWGIVPETMLTPDLQSDKAYSARCCQISHFDFDPHGLNLDPQLLSSLDPLYHIVLHVGRQALSAIPETSLVRERTGVILAAIALPTDFSSAVTRDIIGAEIAGRLFDKTPADVGRTASRSDPRSRYLASRVTSLPAAILAKAFGLGAGTYTLDAACASSLYSVKLACDELHSRRADMMLAGGVSRPNSLFTQVGFSQLKALSPSGRCAPFDARADGLVVGEGAGLVVLKRLADARRDRDSIYGLIHGVGLSNDMRGNLLAPDSDGQLRAMRSAYKFASWSPHDVDLIECHGAGTPLGDLTELKSLTQLWGKTGWQRSQCRIGSVKSMIGHLLTAAGAAGMIKTLLAFRHRILPPSLNFEQAPPNSPLHEGPFRVQTRAEDWNPRKPGRPRRAAVSAFGFGGINAHMLLEEYDGNSEFGSRKSEYEKGKIQLREESSDSLDLPDRQSATTEIVDEKIPHSAFRLPNSDIAIVGMAVSFGPTTSLREFQELIFNGRSNIGPRPPQRWKGCDRIGTELLDDRSMPGGYCRELSVAAGEFHLPPNEIPDILPQQLLMLKVAADAMRDAGLPLRRERIDMGTVIGIDFDIEATNFQLRWQLANMIAAWTRAESQIPDAWNQSEWVETSKDGCNPPLTASRTLGALGGMVASRVAREFRLGGPSFVVSCEEAGGFKALEIGARALQQQEAETFLIGAVDLAGDVRNLILKNGFSAFSRSREIRPFDESADGTLPGEGAAAIVIKRLDRALADGNRVYCVIKGFGSTGGGGVDQKTPSPKAYLRSLEQCCREAGVAADTISLVEAHGSGQPAEDDLESSALNTFFSSSRAPCAVGSVKANIGHAGAASGLASLVKASLALYHEILPPLPNFTAPKSPSWLQGGFHFPIYPQYWLRDRIEGNRHALVAAMTADGNCSHILLKGVEHQNSYNDEAALLQKIQVERSRPLGLRNIALFCIEGFDRQDMVSGLDALLQHIEPFRVAVEPEVSSAGRIDLAALHWYAKNGSQPDRPHAIVLTATSPDNLIKQIAAAKEAVVSDRLADAKNGSGIYYSSHPHGPTGKLAFVFPGSGNHYLGMGRDVAVQWPHILRAMDARTSRLKTQLLPDCYVPWRKSWKPGWQSEAYQRIGSHAHHMIFGQVVHGGVMSDLIQSFGIQPAAVIGYSLGESAGYFAMGVWPERGEMLKRMQATPLFKTDLAGPCNAARQVWQIPPEEDVNWTVAVVNRSAESVGPVIRRFATTRLLIINTPEECVIGGRRSEIEATIKELACDAYYLDGVVTVHCDVLKPVADAYRDLHVFPASQPRDIRFYSCAMGRVYTITGDKAANSILDQALHGFDFSATINQAYQDGVRVFLELGPSASCTRMIDRILGQRPHLALSACVRGEPDHHTVVKVLAALIAERVPVDLEPLYGRDAYGLFTIDPNDTEAVNRIRIPVGRVLEVGRQKTDGGKYEEVEKVRRHSEVGSRNVEVGMKLEKLEGEPSSIYKLIETADEAAKSTAAAHQKFLELSKEFTQSYAETFNLQTELLQKALEESDDSLPYFDVENSAPDTPSSKVEFPGSGIKTTSNSELPKSAFPLPNSNIPQSAIRNPQSNVIFDRRACLEFAIGSVAKVLGPEFAAVDTYAARVRLPDEPLMLVDRILSIEGEKGSMSNGRIVTEHDVLPEAWYLDGGHAPVCISVEAGQADLFLSGYLGIDLQVQGQRTYRLLDATVKFHRELPVPGETIRYEIEIEKFLRQGDTYLFLFHFNGFIGDTRLITMTDGCAGFFTEDEVRNSGGIILTDEDIQSHTGKSSSDGVDFVPVSAGGYDDTAIDALRRGQLGPAFGQAFDGIILPENLRLPGGRMRLLDRVLNLEPNGGRFGLGLIRGEADIDPDAWFLTCHFVDDMVMPGTLMYECCAHTLRIFLQRIGWITENPDVFYEPVRELEATLKCRGPVTPDTAKVVYELEIKEIGYRPEPYVIADAYMYADGRRIVYFHDMSMQMSGISRDEIESFWNRRNTVASVSSGLPAALPLFDRNHMLEFAEGLPSRAFGAQYEPFDSQRFIARLPRPPYLMIDRIVKAQPQPWVLKPDGWIETEFDVDPAAWYFRAERTPAAPISILLEIALQPCGWLAAYMGSALRSQRDLRFRNLGGEATLSEEISSDTAMLTVSARLTNVSEAADMIIEHFDFEVRRQENIIYAGNTYFGFFTLEALAQQEGIRDAASQAYEPTAEDIRQSLDHEFVDYAPLQPQDEQQHASPPLALPARAIRMIDRIDSYIPSGGPQGFGFIRGVKNVDPREWFFRAHFMQDPVCPGSLGIESFIQLLKFAALKRWPDLETSHRFALITQNRHRWIYRGQVIPENKQVTVDAVITKIQDDPQPCILADGYLKVDGLHIYKMENFGIKLVPV